MNQRHLKQIHRLAAYSMTPVMVQAWFLSTKCRRVISASRNAKCGCGLLRDVQEVLA